MNGIKILANGQLTRRAIRCLGLLTVTAGLAVAATGSATAATHPVVAHPTAAYTGPHFRTPQAAMRYLAAAYNHHNATELHYVTTPQSYRELTQLRSQAVNLRLQSCALNRGRGDYTCSFIHDYPPSFHNSGHGHSSFLVAPARNPGWYLYAVLSCG